MAALRVWTVECGGRPVVLVSQEDAEALATVWNLDHEGEGPAAAVTEVSGWSGEGVLWTRLPGYACVWTIGARYDRNGLSVAEYRQVSDRWLWEFETGEWTDAAAVDMVTVARDGTVGVLVRGTDRDAVRRLFAKAGGSALGWLDGRDCEGVEEEPQPLG